MCTSSWLLNRSFFFGFRVSLRWFFTSPLFVSSQFSAGKLQGKRTARFLLLKRQLFFGLEWDFGSGFDPKNLFWTRQAVIPRKGPISYNMRRQRTSSSSLRWNFESFTKASSYFFGDETKEKCSLKLKEELIEESSIHELWLRKRALHFSSSNNFN